MDILGRDDAMTILVRIKKGELFIYPTDTIYGIGCDATNDEAVQRVRSIKQRDTKPFSVIAPSLEWIEHHTLLDPSARKWLVKLPGPYTIILKRKGNTDLSPHVDPSNESIGVRIPAHWIRDIAAKLGRPIVTTSVNLSGQPACSTLEEFTRFAVDFIIYEGPKYGPASTIVRLIDGEQIIRR